MPPGFTLSLRGTGISPRHDGVDLLLRQTTLVPERAEPRVGKPGRHLARAHLFLDRARPRTCLPIRDQRHRSHGARPAFNDYTYTTSCTWTVARKNRNLCETMAVAMRLMRPGHVGLLLWGLLGPLVGTAEPQLTPFSQDVTDAIDAGLTWFRNSTIYSDAGFAPQAKGLALRVLLEKRADADFDAPILGYASAASADQKLTQSAVQAILNDASYGVARGGCRGGGGFHAYGDGENMSALSLYASTGGPNVENICQFTLRSAIDRLVTRTLANQSRTSESSGFWGHTSAGDVSWTTLFAASGLAAAQAYYVKVDAPPGTDPAATAKMTAIAEALERTARGYAAAQNADGGEGHRVNIDVSSYQQTAAGLWASLLGGMELNTSSVQGYLKWHYQNYNYHTIYAAFGNRLQSYYYYLWTSSMAYTTLEEVGQAPDVGNVTTNDLGTLPAGAIRLDRVGDRLAARDPAADFDARVAFVGAEHRPGKYSSEQSSWYYDYAYTLMTQQLATGQFKSNQRRSGGTVSFTNDPSDPYIDHAYAILVLERATRRSR